MWDFFKEFFEDNNTKARTPEVLGLMVLLLLIFKFVLASEFNNLHNILINGLGDFKFIIHVLELLTIMLIFLSIICLFAVTISTIYYLALSIVTDTKKKISQRLSDRYDNVHRFYLGSKRAIMNVDMWLIVIACCFYLFDETSFIKYKDLFLNYISNANRILYLFFFLYGLIIIAAFFRLIDRMKYKFLYFRMNEETERKLYEAKKNIAR